MEKSHNHPSSILSASDSYFHCFSDIFENTFDFDMKGRLRWGVIFNVPTWPTSEIISILEKVCNNWYGYLIVAGFSKASMPSENFFTLSWKMCWLILEESLCGGRKIWNV